MGNAGRRDRPGGGPINDRSLFSGWISTNYPSLSDGAVQDLLRYGALLEEGAARLGLVGRGDRGHILTRHFTEALDPALIAWLPPGSSVLDVGSGGGVPGIPWAIVRGDMEIKLLEPRLKKVAFLERSILALKLANASVFAGTLEELGRHTVSSPWTVAVARGVRWTPAMVRASRGLLAEDGVVLRYGAPAGGAEGVRTLPLESSEDRVIQIWPRSAWQNLPNAR